MSSATFKQPTVDFQSRELSVNYLCDVNTVREIKLLGINLILWDFMCIFNMQGSQLRSKFTTY